MGGIIRNPVVENLLVQTNVPASFPYLIEIWKSSDIQKENIERYVNASEDKVFEGNTFQAASFKINPPEKTESGIKDAQITISTIDQTWIEKVRTTNERYKIRFVAVIDYENGSEYIEKLEDITFLLTSATWQETTLQFTMKFDEGMGINVPCQKLDQFVCPALF